MIRAGARFKIAQNIQRLPQYAWTEIIYPSVSEQMIEDEKVAPLTRAEARQVITELARTTRLLGGYADSIEPCLSINRFDLGSEKEVVHGIAITRRV